MSEPHKRIWLQWYGLDSSDPDWDGEGEMQQDEEVTWCSHRQYDTDIEYTRDDSAQRKQLADELWGAGDDHVTKRSAKTWAQLSETIGKVCEYLRRDT